MKRTKYNVGMRGRRVSAGFSLVEVTIAIGIFAFVIVAVLGLFPVALRQRTDAALETRAVLVAQQVFESIRSSSSTNRIYLPPLTVMGAEDPDLRFKSLGAFPVTLQFGRIGTSALRVNDGDSGWASGATEADADALARVSIVPVAGFTGLYQVTVDYGRPASLKEAQRKSFSFAKLLYMP